MCCHYVKVLANVCICSVGDFGARRLVFGRPPSPGRLAQAAGLFRSFHGASSLRRSVPSRSATLVDRIVAERGSVLHLYQMLLHSPAVAGGWLNYLTSIRQLSTLPGDIRELVIMRVAAINGAPYEADQHAPIALKEGVSQPSWTPCPTGRRRPCSASASARCFAYTDAMTRHVQVPEPVFQAARAAMGSEKLIVELTATVAAYNMVSRFLEALQVHSHDHR